MMLGLLWLLRNELSATVWSYEAVEHAVADTPVALDWRGYQVDLMPTRVGQGVWPLSTTQGHYVLGTGVPGETGNVVVYGHNTEYLFEPFLATTVGEVLNLYTAEGKRISYVVSEVVDTDPTDVVWVEDTDEAVLTIYTCSGWFDRQRRVIRAVLLTE